MKKIITVIGARPQFIKAAVVSKALLANKNLKEIIIHTGQHYDHNMSKIFFDDLKLPKPAYDLKIGSKDHGAQTGLMLQKIEEVLLKEKPDLVLVYGDTNSTLAGSLAAVKLHIPVAHVEAGLRCFDKTVPEEVNRVITDHNSALLFCPTTNALDNLKKEGLTKNVYLTGDVMYDSILLMIEIAKKQSSIMKNLKLNPKKYCLATIHRAENTDNLERLKEIVEALNESKKEIILPLHPRTKKYLAEYKIKTAKNIKILEPLSYLDLLILEKNASHVITDSGGMQKEAYFLKTPCLTLRDVTEWVETVSTGANTIVGADKQKILAALKKPDSTIKELPNHYGNGKAAQKIIEILKRF